MRDDTRTFLLAVLGIPFALSVAWGVHAVSPAPINEKVACAVSGEPEVLSAETKVALPSSTKPSVVPEQVSVPPLNNQPLFVAEPDLVVYERERERHRDDEDDREREREDREDEYDDD